jgi:hypothetical protein
MTEAKWPKFVTAKPSRRREKQAEVVKPEVAKDK